MSTGEVQSSTKLQNLINTIRVNPDTQPSQVVSSDKLPTELKNSQRSSFRHGRVRTFMPLHRLINGLPTNHYSRYIQQRHTIASRVIPAKLLEFKRDYRRDGNPRRDQENKGNWPVLGRGQSDLHHKALDTCAKKVPCAETRLTERSFQSTYRRFKTQTGDWFDGSNKLSQSTGRWL